LNSSSTYTIKVTANENLVIFPFAFWTLLWYINGWCEYTRLTIFTNGAA